MSILRQKKIILTAIIPLFLIIGLSVQSYASTVGVTPVSVTGLGGATYTVNAKSFAVADPAYKVTRVGATSATSLAWSNTAPLEDTTTGNWELQVTVSIPTTEANRPAAGDYAAVCQINNGAGYTTTTTSTIAFTTLADSSGSATFVFDTGVTSLDYITAIVITIQPAA